MIDVVFVVNGQDMAPILESYEVVEEIKYDGVITTMDGEEHPYGKTTRDIIKFELIPYCEFSVSDYEALSGSRMAVEYTKPRIGTVKTQEFRVDGNLSDKFLLHSMDGYNRYTGGTITLRALKVNEYA